ncbi:MAG TPA: SDR family oxidoreductase [Alphaproteobacteria bacterium]|jgi:NAD(P)-dependent dehydrogenase (short-subunit alcohol dehydrogenase family)|nr:SDR family oxidoreductase [Alphaproteobacteria bacterium]
MALPNTPRKTIVLTGASRGIGHATVKRFSSAGWRVITCSRQAFPEDCPWEAGPEDHLQIDLGDTETLHDRIARLRKMLNGAPLEALVNNAGISIKGADGERLDTLETDMDDWRRVFRINFFAPIALARGLIEELKAAQGAIVNVTSIAGSRVHPFAGAAYATSKAALASLTREMAADFGHYGIRVNAIAPGEIQTTILSPGTEEALLPNIPMRRLGAPEEVAKTIYFLCSEQSSYVNGAEIHINGGQHV